MWPYYPELLARPVPRYTSFPTAAEFTDAVGVKDMEAALDRVEPDTPVSLYLHIPYCDEICWYCGCNTGRAHRKHRLDAYLEALASDIDLVSQRLAGRGRVTRIAFGGGSPNAIAPVDFVRLLDRLATGFLLASPQISVELDPRGFTDEWASVLGATRVTHASLGVQTLDPKVQEAIGRVQPVELIRDAVGALRGAGVGSINFDLMYGLPFQDMAVLDATLEASLAMRPDRLALFGYAHVPHLIPRQRRIDASCLPDQDTRFQMASHGYDVMVEQGYLPVGFDHFALPHDPLATTMIDGRLRRNFQGFTCDQGEVQIGLGASAISNFPDVIIQNEKNAGRFRMRVTQGQLPAELGVRRSPRDQIHGEVIQDILCRGEASLTPVGSVGQWRQALAPFSERGLIELVDDRLILMPGALPYARTIAALFDPYRADAPQRFSSAI